MPEALSTITVVLSRPQDAGNIGASCRAMKTMGITRLALAGPVPEDLRPARVLAVHAGDVLDSASRHDSLGEAVAHCLLAAGVTRRIGRWRKQRSLSPEELAEHLADRGVPPTALVFGNEESGLSDEELACCHLAVHIPSSPLFPSLNLSHAVQLVCYALYRRLAGVPAPGAGTGREAVGPSGLSAATEALVSALREAGFFSRGTEEDMRLLYRDLFARAVLSPSEAERVARTFAIQRELVRQLRER